MSGSNPPPPDEIKTPEADHDATTPDIASNDQNAAPALAGIVSDISTKTGAVSPDPVGTSASPEVQDSPLDQIPNLDMRKLNRAVFEFLVKLKMNLPREKDESVDAVKDQLRMTMVEIGMMAEELKKLHANLTPDQSKKLGEVVELVPQTDPVLEKFLTEAQVYWTEQLKTVLDFLKQLQTEGMGIIGTVDENGFQVNRAYLGKLDELLMNMVRSFMEFSREAYQKFLDVNEKMRVEKMKTDHMNALSYQENFRGFNTEDLADTLVDKTLYEELLADLGSDKPANEVVHSLVAAIALNFFHLKNSLAAQNGTVISSYISDLEDGIPEKNIYDKNSPEHTFKSEALAAMHLLTMLSRCLSGVIGSQKIADLIRQAKK